jgi:hypothetical protein
MSEKHGCDEQRDGGVTAARPPIPAGSGGSTPTPSLEFRTGEWQDAKYLILRFHYSKRLRPPVIVGTFHRTDRNGLCVAACVFSPTTVRWREPVMELSRLVRAPRQVVPLSRLISLVCRELKRLGKADLLISYADVEQGHHGGVYQASGWRYHGLRPPSQHGMLIRGRFYPGRSIKGRWGHNSVRLLAKLGIRAKPVYDKGKHLYWRALTPAGAAKSARLGLQDRPYPKPKLHRRRQGPRR